MECKASGRSFPSGSKTSCLNEVMGGWMDVSLIFDFNERDRYYFYHLQVRRLFFKGYNAFVLGSLEHNSKP